MTVTLTTLIALCAPLVHPITMRALVTVESAANPYAISLNYPERLASVRRDVPDLVRQPRSAREALDWTHSLMAQGYTVSVGIAQINVERLDTLRSRSIADQLPDLFDPCVNLRAAQAILVDCWQQNATAAPGARRLAHTLSCFNSGDSTTGLRNGYVQRIVRAAERGASVYAATRTPHGNLTAFDRNHRSTD